MPRTLPNALAIALGALLIAALTAVAVAFLSSGDVEPPRLDAEAWAVEADDVCADAKQTLEDAGKELSQLPQGTIPTDDQIERYAEDRAAGYEAWLSGLRALEGPEADADDAEELASLIEEYGSIEGRYFAAFVELDLEAGQQPGPEMQQLEQDATDVGMRSDELAKSLDVPGCALSGGGS